jgi:hypothetical protein
VPRISVPSLSIIGRKTLTGPDILAHAPIKKGNRLSRPVAVSAAAFERILEEKLQPIHQAILELTAELRRATRRPRRDSIDPRKVNIARVIKSRKPYPKMSVPEILREMDRLQERFPKDESYKPVPAWNVRFWSDIDHHPV